MTSFASCGMAYRLQRVDGVAETPALWNAAGTAFHECIREWETINIASLTEGSHVAVPLADDQAERFAHHLAEQIAKTVLETGVNFSTWRVAKGGKEDRTWWLDNAPAWVANYVTAALARESAIHDIAGVPAMEVEFLWTPAPSLPPVKGFIDQVHRFPNGDILIRDLKSGSSRPVDPIQLMVYRLALEDEYGVTVPSGARWWGDWWMARQGRAVGDYYSGKTLDLTDRSAVEAQVFNRLAIMDAAERSGFYMPRPSISCTSCGVRAACPVMGDPATARPWTASVLTGQ